MGAFYGLSSGFFTLIYALAFDPHVTLFILFMAICLGSSVLVGGFFMDVVPDVQFRPLSKRASAHKSHQHSEEKRASSNKIGGEDDLLLPPSDVSDIESVYNESEDDAYFSKSSLNGPNKSPRSR